MAPEILYRVIYGSSTLTPVSALLAAKLTIRPAMLHNYCRHRVKHCDYPGIIPQAGHCVRGTYVEGLTDADVHHLDVFEGGEYERRKVGVRIPVREGGEEIEGEEKGAQVYVFTAGEDSLEKKEWDFEEFRREKMFRWTDASWEFLSGGTEGDPTGGRSIAHEQADGDGGKVEELKSAA